jgi:hypothetical protein
VSARVELALAHLRARLAALEAPLRAAIAARQAVSDAVYPPGTGALYVTAEHAVRALDAIAVLRAPAGAEGAPPPAPAEDEILRRRAAAAGVVLPLDALAAEHGLDRFEEDVLVLCAAPEIDRAYERVFGFVVDDLARGAASVELCCAVGAPPWSERLRRRRCLGALGRLRRTGLVETRGEPPTDLRQELRLPPVVLDALLGGAADLRGVLGDPGEVTHGGAPPPPSPVVAGVARALAAGHADAVTLSGGHDRERRDAVLALAGAAGRALRRIDDPTPAAVRAAMARAAVTGAILWLPAEVAADGGAGAGAGLAPALELLARCPLPLCLSSARPWRPLALLATRRVLEVALPEPALDERARAWHAHFPTLSVDERDDLAARFRVGDAELGAAARWIETRRRAVGPTRDDAAAVDGATAAAAVRAVTHASGGTFVHAVVPRRGPDDLVLEPGLHAQVLEVARFHRAWPRVAESWGFGRLVTGGGGVKALFTGDPGTGKTLAAEVLAALLGQTLLRVDLAHVVSKWVGETEKNLDEAFLQAERGQAVLFFDEAEALFGKRAEVRQATDRYANLEVSYLLQRLEDHAGLVILASNLREQLDAAFSRRFQIVLHFPRPAEPERRRLWRLAFPPGAPLAGDVRLDALAQVDLTGAAIVGAARTAALLASAAGRGQIAVADVLEAIGRELAREGRFMPPGDLAALKRSA